jgi:hypothetical protein
MTLTNNSVCTSQDGIRSGGGGSGRRIAGDGSTGAESPAAGANWPAVGIGWLAAWAGRPAAGVGSLAVGTGTNSPPGPGSEAGPSAIDDTGISGCCGIPLLFGGGNREAPHPLQIEGERSRTRRGSPYSNGNTGTGTHRRRARRLRHAFVLLARVGDGRVPHPKRAVCVLGGRKNPFIQAGIARTLGIDPSSRRDESKIAEDGVRQSGRNPGMPAPTIGSVP